MTSYYYENETFEHYLDCCQWYNNGSLKPIDEKLSTIRRRLAEVEHSADEYGMEYYTDEIENLTGEIDRLTKYLEV